MNQDPLQVDEATHSAECVAAASGHLRHPLEVVERPSAPHGVALVRDGAIAPFVEHHENPIVEAHANGFVAWNGNVLVWALGLDRSPVRVVLEDNDRGGTRRRYDWESFRLEQDDAVLVARTRMLRIPLAAEPAARLVAPVTVPSIGEFPLEKGTVFFAGDARVLIEHASRGRFWFDVAESGLVKGEVVEIGKFQSDGAFPSAETIATTLVRDGQVLATAVPSVAVAGPVVVGTRVEGKPRKKTKPLTALTSTIDMLVEYGFMDPLTDAAFTELFEDVLGEDYEAGATTAADILSAVHENGTGIALGFSIWTTGLRGARPW